MNDWDATNYAAKENLLRVLRREADALFEMAENGPWTSKTACTEWETRDIVGHLIDVTESYFVAFDAARSGSAVADHRMNMIGASRSAVSPFSACARPVPWRMSHPCTP